MNQGINDMGQQGHRNVGDMGQPDINGLSSDNGSMKGQ